MIDFSQVTDVTIPEGDVIKITETSSGRVLWEKKGEEDEIYSSFAFFLYMTRGHMGTDLCCNAKYIAGQLIFENYTSKDTTLGFINTSLPLNGSLRAVYVVDGTLLGKAEVHTIAEIAAMPPSKIQKDPNEGWIINKVGNVQYLIVGDTFTACYVTKASEEANIPTSTRKMTDAVWKISDVHLYAVNADELVRIQGYMHGYNGVSFAIGAPSLMHLVNGKYVLQLDATSSPPITLSTQQGATTKITKIVDLSGYKAVYESYVGQFGYRTKTEAPYLYGVCMLSVSSLDFKTLLGYPNAAGALLELLFYFTVAR